MFEKPIVNLNGTGANALLEETSFALRKVYEAMSAVVDITVHPRDYPNGGYEKANSDADVMKGELLKIWKKLVCRQESLQDQIDERERQQSTR